MKKKAKIIRKEMSRKFLIIDTCIMCPYLIDYGLHCRLAGKRFGPIWDGKTIPDWCPLADHEEKK